MGVRRRLAVFATIGATVLVTGSLTATTALAEAPQPPETPQVIPALTDWTPSDGSYQFDEHSRIVVPPSGHNSRSLAQTAETLAGELEGRFGRSVSVVHSTNAAREGDIVLKYQSAGEEIGPEGYEMTVGETVQIEGTADDGIFYGTRTLLQMLTLDVQVPQGHTIDVPRYAERGLGLGLTRYSMGRLERLLEEMAYLKLNYLLLEVPIQSESHPEAVRWPYYTKDEVAQIVDLAEKYHVTVIPEVNAPGHIGPYIFDRPDLQLEDKNGNKYPHQLDITNPDAFEFYIDLVDEWSEAFDSPYWHMGADEYMWGTSFDNYPVIGEYAKENFGPDAAPVDVVIDFINRVDDHVNSNGMQLRIWNDGIPAESTVSLNSDIIIEHWEANEAKPSDHIEAGNTVMNAASALYHNAGSRRVSPTSLCGDVPVGETTLNGCVAKLWNDGWDPGVFEDERLDPADPNITGAKLMLWPGTVMSETEIQSDIFMPMRFIAQRTWGNTEKFISYEDFTARAEALANPPGWNDMEDRPTSDGQYAMRPGPGGETVAPAGDEAGSVLVASGDEERWQLRRTDDGYYEIVSASTGLCMDRGGVEPETSPTTEVCAGSTEQKWELTPRERGNGFVVKNAASQMALDLPDDGLTIVQVPPHQADGATAAWRFDLMTAATVDIDVPADGMLLPGSANMVTATFTNTGDDEVTDVGLTLRANDDWQVTGTSDTEFASVAPNQSVTAEWAVTPPEDLPAGAYGLGVAAAYTVGGDSQTVSQNAQIQTAPPGRIPQSRLSVHDFSSEERPTTGFATNAIDGNPISVWHTAWSQTDPDPSYPHFISLNLGGEYLVDGLEYLPKQDGNSNGLVKGYVISVSQNGQDWTEVATGEFPDTRAATRVNFESAQARYVKLTGTSSINGNPYMAVAELNIFGEPVQ